MENPSFSIENVCLRTVRRPHYRLTEIVRRSSTYKSLYNALNRESGLIRLIDVIDLLDAEPERLEINSEINRNEFNDYSSRSKSCYWIWPRHEVPSSGSSSFRGWVGSKDGIPCMFRWDPFAIQDAKVELIQYNARCMEKRTARWWLRADWVISDGYDFRTSFYKAAHSIRG